MISLKKYLDGDLRLPEDPDDDSSTLTVALAAYGAAMLAMGACSLEACPSLGDELQRRLSQLQSGLSAEMGRTALETTSRAVAEGLDEWGQGTARHYRQKAAEVKELLLTMARTAESVGARDRRAAEQMNEVTLRLRKIATLDQLTEIRASIEKSAADLKTSVERMTVEGKAAVEQLRREVKIYQTKLEEAEELASRDNLTGLRNRMFLESLIETRIAAEAPFCVAMIDIDDFKKVNDTYGHLTGDELLRQFAIELRSTYRSTDAVGRWGGDEFVILLDCDLEAANARIDRLREWVCGDYTVRGKGGTVKLHLDISIGLAEHFPQESLKALVARADAAMYAHKTAGRGKESLAARKIS